MLVHSTMGVIVDKNVISAIFDRGVVVGVLPSKDALIERLCSGDQLKIYIGADPTSKALHLSHAKNYVFLEELRRLGHQVIILFGDFTAQIGDPSSRTEARKPLSRNETSKNAASWVDQIRPLMDFEDKDNLPKILYNSEWLSKLSFGEVIGLATNFTVQQMLERDMFEKRIARGQPVYVHELLYPLMQGYDSVAMDVDVELCGTDQTFNALAGRTLMNRLKNKDKFIITLNLMENPKTGEIMSKSQGRGVFLSSPPNEMYGAIMSQPDEMTELFLINNTRIPLDEIREILASGPRRAKARAALEIVCIFYGQDKASLAADQFDATFRDRGLPQNIEQLEVSDDRPLIDGLVALGIVSSKTDWRRLVDSGAVRDDMNNKINDYNFKPLNATVLKIGKHRFVKILPKH